MLELRAHTTCGRARFLFVCMCAAAVFACACLALATPNRAFAYFNDYLDADPYSQDASQSLPPAGNPFGEIIFPEDIPDGTYPVYVNTSSFMCVAYPSAGDCEAKTNQGMCTLQVSDGTMTVFFYLSKAYTHLYWGTAAEAAAATNEDGTDGSAYIAGNPSSGYVPHYFALQIPALEWPMDISTYGGNDADFPTSQWRWRQIAFRPSAEIYAAIGGFEPEPEPEPEPQPEPEPEAPGSTDYSDLIDQINEMTNNNNTAAAATSTANVGARGTDEEDAAAAATSNSSAAVPSARSGEVRQGVLLIPVELEQSKNPGGSDNVPQLVAATSFGLTMAQILALTCGGAIAIGALARALLFMKGKR